MKQTCETCVYWNSKHPSLKDYGTCLVPTPFWVTEVGDEVTYKLAGNYCYLHKDKDDQGM